jgi:hypothetical protein
MQKKGRWLSSPACYNAPSAPDPRSLTLLETPDEQETKGQRSALPTQVMGLYHLLEKHASSL